MIRCSPLRSLAGLALALLANAANAQLSCTVVTAPPVLFGTYNPLLFSPLDAQSSMNVRCSGAGLSLLRVRLTAGLNGSVSARAMLRGTSSLSYGLYTDSARSNAWGDGTGGTSLRFLLAFPSSDATLQIYGRVPARQNVPGGAYSDTVTIRLDW